MTLKFNFDLEFCITVSWALKDRLTERKNWVKLNENCSRVLEIWSKHKLQGKSQDLEV